MKRVAAVLGIISGIVFALGKDPQSLMASGYVLLVFMGFGKLAIGDKKPFGQPFWISVITLLFLPFLVCQAILSLGWHYIILALVLSAFIYIYFNTRKDGNSKITGGERSPLNDSHFNESDFNDSEFTKFSWDDREVN